MIISVLPLILPAQNIIENPPDTLLSPEIEADSVALAALPDSLVLRDTTVHSDTVYKKISRDAIEKRVTYEAQDSIVVDLKNRVTYLFGNAAGWSDAGVFIPYRIYEKYGDLRILENNYEAMLREFMASQTKRSLVIITQPEGKLLDELKQKLNYERDKRIRFIGTVYDQPLLREIRRHAFAYLHGHEVGGTNPSLLEALGERLPLSFFRT